MERFGSLHFVSQSDALEADLLRREMEEANAAAADGEAEAVPTTGSRPGGEEGEEEAPAHSSVRDNKDTTNGNYDNLGKLVVPTKTSSRAMSSPASDDDATESAEANGATKKESGGGTSSAPGASAAKGEHKKRNHKTNEKSEEPGPPIAIADDDESQPPNMSSGEVGQDSGNAQAKCDAALAVSSAAVAVSSDADQRPKKDDDDDDDDDDCGGGGGGDEPANKSLAKKQMAGDNDNSNTAAAAVAGDKKDQSDTADEKKEDFLHQSPPPHGHGHHGRHRGHRGHGHGHHGKKQPPPHGETKGGDTTAQPREVEKTTSSQQPKQQSSNDGGAVGPSKEASSAKPKAGQEEKVDEESDTPSTHTTPSSSKPTRQTVPDARTWFAQTLTTGCQRSAAASITDPAFVELFLELVGREAAASASSSDASSDGDGTANGTATGGPAQYPLAELTRLYGEYHRAAEAAAAAAANAAHAGHAGGGGGKKKGGKNKAKARGGAAATSGTTATATSGTTATATSGTAASGTTTSGTTTTGTTASGATATANSGTTASTGSTATAATPTDSVSSGSGSGDKVNVSDNAYRIRGESKAKARAGEGGGSDKVDGSKKKTADVAMKDAAALEEGPKMIIQYKSGLVVPVTVTRTSVAGTNAGAAAATTRAVLAAAERTKNSPASSPSAAKAASASAIPLGKPDDNGDIGSMPSFSALGGGGGGNGSSPSKASADVEEAAARELAATASTSSSTVTESSKKAKKKAKKARQQANKVVRAKQAAAQAMGRQAARAAVASLATPSSAPSPSSATASLDQMELLRHVRIVLPSALGFASPGKTPPSGGQDWGKPFGPVLVLDPEFLDASSSAGGGGDSNALLDLFDRIVGQVVSDTSFLSKSSTGWTGKLSQAATTIPVTILLLARFEKAIRAAHATATDASSNSTALDSIKEHPGALESILSTSTSSLTVAAGTDMALQNALELWVRIRANENDEGVMLLSSKVHSDMHGDLPASYLFRLEDVVAVPLQLLSISKAHLQSTERSRWWNTTITPPLRDVKKQMQSIPVLSGSDQKVGGGPSKGGGAGADNSGSQTTPSKSKKKKKKKSKKKKAAAAAAAAGAKPGGDVDSNVAENALSARNMSTATQATGKPSKDERQSPSSSGEVPSIHPSISTDHSSADSVTSPTQTKTTAISPTRGSITIGAGNNTVVGLGRMMEEEEHHDDGWETVPAKGSEKRNNNSAKKSGAGLDNKGGGASGGGRQQQQHHHHHQQQQQPQSPGKKKKNKSKAARKKEQARKLVNDIVSGILDNVEREVDRRRHAALRAEGRRRANEERKAAMDAQNAQSKSASLRAIVTGAPDSLQPSVDRKRSMSNFVDREDRGKRSPKAGRPRKEAAAGSPSTGGTPLSGIMPTEMSKNGDKASVGQKTAPTLPDTVSGRSTSGGTRGRTAVVDKAQAPPTTVTGVESSVSTDGTATPAKTATTGTAQPPQDSSPQPPLPICNTVSASSSVASSLEAPHATRHRPRGRSHELKEDDVGYHLVKLCDKLSAEMAVFMERRAMALSIRRTERSALLGALQDAASKVFSGHGRVETYGSCATHLDLPSSDLDVVICGLNDVDPTSNSRQGSAQAQDGKMQQKGKGKKSKGKGGGESHSKQGGQSTSPNEDSSSSSSSSSSYVSQQQRQQQPQHQPPHYQQYPPQYYQYYPPPSPSGLKVLRLASELEMQPWAVQVKAIPTATVPVIKLLADPTRVPGGAVWMMQPQHMPPVPMPPPQPQQAQQQAQQQPTHEDGTDVAQSQGHGQPQAQPQQAYYNGPVSSGGPMSFIHPAAMPWRGADIMNGLISIDITFEGPEHGGIGSTIFSQAFVHEVCTESNLPPEATAAVQMIMVIKELLAQRRLNEPYSGGLSSFAVLLLAVSVIRERRLIQDEMKRMEKQRRAVEAAVEGPNNAPKNSKSKKKASKQQHTKERSVADKYSAEQPAQSGRKGNKKDNASSVSVTSTATPVAKASRTVKQESKHTQTDEGEAPTSGAVSTKDGANMVASRPDVPEQTESTQKKAAATAANDMPPSDNPASAEPTKGGFSFKDALKGNVKPKPSPAKKDAGEESTKQTETAEKAPSGPKSWASIAKTKSQPPTQPQAPVTEPPKKERQQQPEEATETSQSPSATPESASSEVNEDAETSKKPGFDSEAKGKSSRKKSRAAEPKSTEASKKATESTPITSATVVSESVADEQSKPQAPTESAAASAVSASASESIPARSGGGGTEEARRQLPFPQGSNDVLEVLCTGEPTAGKLLMHFLLFYGQHFESQATAVDVSGVHHPDIHRYRNRPYGSYRLSSYVPRHAGGSIDPVTGMYTVDPIVIYDPLEGCENNNVARSCFAWASIRSVFHQCYMTLSGACERGSGTTDPPFGIGGSARGLPSTNRPSRSSSAESGKATDAARQQQAHRGQHQQGTWGQGPTNDDSQQQQVESVLALLLSF